MQEIANQREKAMNITQYLWPSFECYGEKPAILHHYSWVSYREILEEVLRHMIWLQEAGIRQGDRVALILPKGLSFIYWHLATMGIGAISLPLNPGHKPKELYYMLNDAECSLLITHPVLFQLLGDKISSLKGLWILLLEDEKPGPWNSIILASAKINSDGLLPVSTELDDVAMILYTSGTTGKPKGAMITHRNLIFNIKTLCALWKWTSQDTLLHVLPLYHIHGLVAALYPAFFCGARVVLTEKFDPLKTWQIMEREKCTIFTAVPTIYFRLLKELQNFHPDLSSMHLFISGAAPLPEYLFHNFESITGFRILERYGMTEAGIIASNPLNPAERLPKSVGYPLPGVEIRVVSENGKPLPVGEIGEVCVRGDNIFQGYWRDSSKTREVLKEGWLHTGDLGFLDHSGRLILVGRVKELIITGGENVYPKEVEEILEQHPAINEAAVLGFPDEDYGERVLAVISCKKGIDPPTAQEIIQFCKEHLVSFKCPKEVYIVDQLPRNTLGKIEKKILKQKLCSLKKAGSFLSNYLLVGDCQKVPKPDQVPG